MRSHGDGIPLCLCFLLPLLLAGGALGGRGERREPYVVYMGAVPADASVGFLRESHLQLLGSVLRGQSAERVLTQQYKHGFSGFAARLSKEEALALKRKPGVVSVFPDPTYQLHTTRSWDFLQQTSVEITAASPPASSPPYDTIISLLDTGIWPESPSFRDDGFGAIPSRWKGVCMAGDNFTASNCNKKLIGARYYDLGELKARGSSNSPRDEAGHGTHTSSTAAGGEVAGASYYGLAAGTARGGSPSSRVAMYQVCSEDGCPGSAILAGFDDAIADGVDVLSVSIGSSPELAPDFADDPIAIGAFHAAARGVTVVCSAGNSGPEAASVVNAAPWILTVAATTIDRDLESDVVLGGNSSAVRGEAINFSTLDKSPRYPLILGRLAKSNSTSDVTSASHCEPGALDGSKIKGKIVVCDHSDDDMPKMMKVLELKTAGAVGAILVDDSARAVATTFLDFPVTEITSQAAQGVLRYIDSTSNPVATIAATITVQKYKPAPVVPYFSSRGPSAQTGNILKPDVAAPGVNILASWIPTSSAPSGQKASQFNVVSGTSMACPHVAAAAANIKAWNPTWSPAAIRSAIATTATRLNNEKAPMTTDTGSVATPYDYGAGQVSPTGALEPGLVYELGTDDYVQFLCDYGYDASKIKLIGGASTGFTCRSNSSKDMISNLNYPSMAVTNLRAATGQTVRRVVTNVGAQEETTYAVSVESPAGLDVKVAPEKLQFTKSVRRASFQVTFSARSSAPRGPLAGSIAWSDGKHRVRSTFVVENN